MRKTPKYIKANYAGVLQARRSRATGTVVTIYLAEEAGLDPAGGDYVTVCEDHGTLCNHQSLTLARAHAPYVEWCEECQGAEDALEHCAICDTTIVTAELCGDCAVGNNPFFTSKYVPDPIPNSVGFATLDRILRGEAS